MVDTSDGENYYCLGKTLIFINKKWSIELIRDMFFGKKRFKDFEEGRSDLSNKVLSECLKNLEDKGIIKKKMTDSKPTSTRYYLTQQGKSLNRVIYELMVFSQEKNFSSVGETLAFFSKKWNIEIIKDIFFGKKHFKDFKEGRSDLSNKVLSECLKNLENNGIIEKRIINSKPFYTEYHLTELGKSLNRLIYELVIFNLENSGEKNHGKESTYRRIKENLREVLKINY